MTDPRDINEQEIGDEQPHTEREEEQPVDELEVRAEDGNEVKGGRRGDPCEGGEIASRIR